MSSTRRQLFQCQDFTRKESRGPAYGANIMNALESVFYYLRANGLPRYLYLVCLAMASRWLEPLRSFAVDYLVLPGKRKMQLFALWITVGLIGAAATLLWDDAAQFLGEALGPIMFLAVVASLSDDAPWLFLFVLLAVYFQYVHAKLAVVLRVRYWQAHKTKLLEVGATGYVMTVERLGLQAQWLKALKEELEKSSEVAIAEIDQDGFLLCRFGPIPCAATTAPESFVERKRLALEVVVIGDKVGVKKHYRGNTACFLNELECLHALAGRCNVPAILDVDFAHLTLTVSFIPGAVLREELAQRGALLRHRDVDGNPDHISFTREDRNLKRIEEGKRVMSDCVNPMQVDEIFAQVQRAHKAGVGVRDVKYGNIVIERDSGEPYLIDFDRSRYYSHPHGLSWEVERDCDIEQFNLCFSTHKLTRDRILQKIAGFSRGNSKHRPGPVDFGHGMAMGRIWDTESGAGRWRSMLKSGLPSFSGRRVLDLGCQDTYFLLQALRHGAVEAIGIEPDDAWSEPAQLIKEGFEWADSVTYAPQVIRAHIEDVLTLGLGRFDLVTAFCMLYELDDELVEPVVQHVRTLTECFIIQCNTGLGKHCPETRLKASVDYGIRVLERNGFGAVRLVAPSTCRRPLLIGTKV